MEEFSGNETINKLDTDTLRKVHSSSDIINHAVGIGMILCQEEWIQDMCSSEGHLDGVPDSVVTLVGCPGDEDGQVLVIVTKEPLFKGGVYR